jgi:heme exporter protein B
VTSFGAQVYALVAKDLLLELRNRESVTSVLVYALLVLVTFNFALDLRPEIMDAVGPGVLWVAVVFTGPIWLARAFSDERDRGTLEMLLAAPIERSALFAAKLAGSVVVMVVAQLVLVPAFVALFNVHLDLLVLIPSLFLGDVGLAAVGTIFSAIAAHTRAREVLLPVLIFPIIVPLVIAVVQATGLAMGNGLAQDRPWIGLLVAFDAVYIAVGSVLFEYVLEE